MEILEEMLSHEDSHRVGCMLSVTLFYIVQSFTKCFFIVNTACKM